MRQLLSSLFLKAGVLSFVLFSMCPSSLVHASENEVSEGHGDFVSPDLEADVVTDFSIPVSEAGEISNAEAEEEKKKMSTGKKVAIGLVAALAVGGIAYAVYDKNKSKGDGKKKDEIDLSQAEWWGDDASGWREVSNLGAEKTHGDTTNFVAQPPLPGGDVVAAAFVYRDGRWVGGGFDGMGNKTGGTVKTLSNIVGTSKGGPIMGRHGPNSEAVDRAYLRPKKGEKVAFSLISRATQTRTNASTIVWPYDHWGTCTTNCAETN